MSGNGYDWLEKPGSTLPRLVPVEVPGEHGGFRFAVTSDGSEEDGRPRVSAERGWVTDGAERARLLRYLEGGALVVNTNRAGQDHFEPSRHYAVPVRYRTDGVWVWPASVEYYLRWHNVAPEPEFYRWIVEHDYVAPAVAADVVTAARRATYERSEVIEERKNAYLVANPTAGPGDEERFAPEVSAALVRMGWAKGRDVRERVDAWLARWVDVLADLPFERDGFPRYEPFPAALDALYEFGGLATTGGGSGETMAKIPFRIFPVTGDDDMMEFVFDAQFLADRIGRRVFQIGDVERGIGGLVIDEAGEVYTVGPADLYAGGSLDEALTRMLRGIRLEDLHELGR